MPDIWIQRANFGVKEIYDVEPQTAMDVLQRTNWAELIAETWKLLAAGKPSYHVGFGIVFKTGDLLHLIEPEKPPYQGLFHFYSERKIFGLFPVTNLYTQSFYHLTEENLMKILENWQPGQSDCVIDLLLSRKENS